MEDYIVPTAHYMGIDPSTVSTGFAILDEQGKLIKYGTINPPAGSSDASKMEYVYRHIREMIVDYNSSEYDSEDGWIRNNEMLAVGIEDQFNGPNVMTLIKIARMASMCILASEQSKIATDMFYPSQWRLIFHGTGKATKRETLALVNDMHGLSLKGKDNDVADAIGIAHAIRQKCLGVCADTKKK